MGSIHILPDRQVDWWERAKQIARERTPQPGRFRAVENAVVRVRDGATVATYPTTTAAIQAALDMNRDAEFRAAERRIDEAVDRLEAAVRAWKELRS